MRLPLATTLTDLLGGVASTPDGGPVHVTSVVFDLPLEVRLSAGEDEPVLLANLPRWRWITDFDARPGRLYASFELERSA